jgi:thiol-disulfide isomerase/thioredoxin
LGIGGLLLAVALLAAGGAPGYAQGDEAKELKKIAYLDDPLARIAAVEKYLSEKSASPLAPAARLVLVHALVEAHFPARRVADATKQFLATAPTVDANEVKVRAQLTAFAIDYALALEGGVAPAREIAETFVATTPSNEATRGIIPLFMRVVGETHLRDGNLKAAIATLREIVDENPDDQTTLSLLGDALRAGGKRREAIDAFVRAESVFGGEKVDGAALRELYLSEHGSIAGLDAELARERAASKKRIALDARRVEAVAPAWALEDLGGNPLSLEGLRGKVVVLDFWATWCPPCREELPAIERLHAAYAGNEVVLVGVNCEGVADPILWQKRVRRFVEEQKLTFPIVNDLESALNDAYSIDSLPTLVVIDRKGTIRYRNVGYEPMIAEILAAQIESLE